MSLTRRSLLAGAAAGLGARAAAPRRPNLVYVFADQLRYQSCGYSGDEYARTPNIDKLAGQGCNLREAVSSTPVCAPYRASLMTGKCQSSTGMVINELRLSPEHETFGGALKRGGYRTGYIGKWHLWANQLGHHEETRNGFVPPGAYRLGFDDYWSAYNFNHTYYHSPYFENDTTRHIRKQYEPDEQTSTAIEFMKQSAGSDTPFALFLSWGPPHDPWDEGNVPAAYLDLFRNVTIPKRPNYSEVSDPYADNWAKLPANYPKLVDAFQRVYYAQSANIDWNVGRIMEALERLGLAGDTILVFTSDHGEMFGAHGRRAKYIFYEEAARVPFLVRWPGHIRAGFKSDALLGTPDIMPTLLSMLGVRVPRAVEGADLSRHILGKGGRTPGAVHMQGMGTTAAWTDGTEWRAVRDREHTYAVYRRDGRELLFRHATDPYQMHDLAGEKSAAATLRHYRELSQRARKERNDTFEACTWYRDRWTKDRNITMTATGVGQDLGGLARVLGKWGEG
ncbi:MAG: sulfatase [Acidobacteria bacterium]|nr:sulfatase [Acidobacteriota bacterium]